MDNRYRNYGGTADVFNMGTNTPGVFIEATNHTHFWTQSIPVDKRLWVCDFCRAKDIKGSSCPHCGATRPDEYDK